MLTVDSSPRTESAGALDVPPQNILVIDDDNDLLTVLSHRLQSQGFNVITCREAARGKQLATQRRPHLILLDLHLPDGDGLQLCEQLSDGQATSDIPIIVISGDEQVDIIRRCRAAGCHYFLRKPYDPNALLTLIRNALAEAA